MPAKLHPKWWTWIQDVPEGWYYKSDGPSSEHVYAPCYVAMDNGVIKVATQPSHVGYGVLLKQCSGTHLWGPLPTPE